MCDTFNPLKLTRFAKNLDVGVYWQSWYTNAESGAEPLVDGDPSDARLTSHF